MNTPAQIITALAAAGAAAILPLSSQFHDAGLLEEAVAKKNAATEKAAAAANPSAGKNGVNPNEVAKAAGTQRIPAGVSPADASRTIAELAALDGKMMSSRHILELMDKIMSLPPSHMEEARAAIQNSKNPIMGGFLTAALFSRWGELDPAGAKVALEANVGGNPILKFAGAAALAGGWMEKDPDGFIEWIAKDPKDSEGLSPQEKQKQKELRDIMMGGVMGGMADIDSAMAEKLIAASPKERRPWLIMDMASKDPNADPRDTIARALTEAGEDSGARSGVLWRAGDILARKDPLEAIKFADEQKPEERNRIYQTALQSWIQKDKPEAMKWLKAQPEDVQSESVRGMREDVRGMSFEEVQKLSGEVSPKAGYAVYDMALDSTASKNPEQALQYLPHVSPEQRPHSYNEIAQQWVKKDPSAASEWIDGLAVGKEKDHAIQGMVGELRSKEPDSSTVWASTMSDQGMRERAVTENARTWLKRDEAAATEWINATDTISEDVRTKLLEGK